MRTSRCALACAGTTRRSTSRLRSRRPRRSSGEIAAEQPHAVSAPVVRVGFAARQKAHADALRRVGARLAGGRHVAAARLVVTVYRAIAIVKVDQPLAAGDAIHGVAFPLPNVTRIVVQGETSSEWLKLRIDPLDPAIFSWQRMMR